VVTVVPPELAAGFRLAGAVTETAADGAEAARVVQRLLAEGLEGVVVVYEPYLDSFDPGVAERTRGSLTPVVVPLPAGLREVSGDTRRARLAELLTRAVGYQITFGAREQS
jgi:vacuolar-type H+-ATPase subunit F/Vma7